MVALNLYNMAIYHCCWYHPSNSQELHILWLLIVIFVFILSFLIAPIIGIILHPIATPVAPSFVEAPVTNAQEVASCTGTRQWSSEALPCVPKSLW